MDQAGQARRAAARAGREYERHVLGAGPLDGPDGSDVPPRPAPAFWRRREDLGELRAARRDPGRPAGPAPASSAFE